MCDSDITSDEIIEALTAMSKNKNPGSDGLTTEFYCTFYDSPRNILPKIFNAAYDEGVLSRSMKSGVMSLPTIQQVGFSDTILGRTFLNLFAIIRAKIL
jgi:hypothetical protein